MKIGGSSISCCQRNGVDKEEEIKQILNPEKYYCSLFTFRIQEPVDQYLRYEKSSNHHQQNKQKHPENVVVKSGPRIKGTDEYRVYRYNDPCNTLSIEGKLLASLILTLL